MTTQDQISELWHQAQRAYQSGEVDKANHLLSEVACLPDAPLEAYLWYAKRCIEVKDWQSGLKALERLLKAQPGFAPAWLEAGNIHLWNRQLKKAVYCYRQAIEHDPKMATAHNNLGSALKDQGLLAEAIASFDAAVSLKPDYASAHSSLLFSLHYVPNQTMAALFAAHQKWADIHLVGDVHQGNLPFSNAEKTSEHITVGLLSPDLNYHPVGIFLLPWLRHHDRRQFRLIGYADSKKSDNLSKILAEQCALWRQVDSTDDNELLQQIQEDGVDVLMDLAGHTAGNRLKLFARRAAPIQVSWLGYSSTTGVPAMDYILMDDYSAPAGYEECFTEKLIRLDGLRFCYTPPEYAPAVSPAPISQKGYVTFGSFNNLAKVTSEVIETWAAILKAVANSHLVLKWKSLGDTETRDRLIAAFLQHGIDAARIECRGWSSHPQMLAEYGEIDIALDPFPFSGGLTTCDALYMGVPVLTWPGQLPISRQTGGFLNALGLTEWIADSREAYIDNAVAFANQPNLLSTLRHNLRTVMVSSRLCEGLGYARAIEKTLLELSATRNVSPIISSNYTDRMKTFLHVGCGPKRKDQTTRGFNTGNWSEIRLDIDPSVAPDVTGTMTDMGLVASESVDAIFSSHNIEHLYPHEVPVALGEFLRVLRPDGFIVITCPDLQSVCALVAEDKLTESAYTSPAGPIAPIDILYGHRPAMARGNLFMAHRCGFTEKVLQGTLVSAGFQSVATARRPAPFFDLWALVSKAKIEESDLRMLAQSHFPV